MKINWDNYIWDDTNLDGLEKLPDFEKKTGIKFPIEYLEIITKHQGKTPEPSIFKIGDKFTTVFNTLYHFSSDEDNDFCNLEKRYESLKENYSDKIIPFGDTPSDDSICFDYRESANNPKIIYIIHELSGDESVKFVADSFTEFLDMLYEDEEE